MIHFIQVFTQIAIWTIFAQTLNLTLGYTGIMNLAHAGFIGIGAYTTAILSKMYGFGLFTSLIAGGLVAAIAALLIGLPTLRLKEHYFAIASLGFGGIIYALLLNWQSLTRGPFGIPGIPKPQIFSFTFSEKFHYLLLAIVVAVIVNIIIYKFIKSPYGKTLESIREDEIAAETIGKNVFRTKLEVLTLAAFLGGVGGGVLAYSLTIVHPDKFTLHETILVFLMVVFGGLGSFWGAIIGPVIVLIIPELIRYLPIEAALKGSLQQLIYALILISLIILRPQGMFGKKLKSLKVS